MTSRVHHHPVQCRPIVGFRNDMINVDETVARMEAAGLKGVTLVMDRGMVSAPNLRVVRKAGYHRGDGAGWNCGAVGGAGEVEGEGVGEARAPHGAAVGGADVRAGVDGIDAGAEPAPLDAGGGPGGEGG